LYSVVFSFWISDAPFAKVKSIHVFGILHSSLMLIFEKNKQFDHVCDCQLKTGILKDIALSRWCGGHATSLLTEKSAKCVELKEELNVPSQDGTLKCVM